MLSTYRIPASPKTNQRKQKTLKTKIEVTSNDLKTTSNHLKTTSNEPPKNKKNKLKCGAINENNEKHRDENIHNNYL